MRKFIRLWRRHPVLTSGFLLAAALTLLFAVRSVMFTLHWADPAHRDQAVETWMTPRYIAHSWQLPREVLATALDLPPVSGRPKTLGRIAADRGLTLDDLEALILAAATAYREAGE